MKLPDLQMLAHWLEPALVSTLDARRRKKKEWQRRRKLATLQTLWLMLAVSLDTQRTSLHEILRLATGQLGIHFSVSVPAFCKARARFSPQRPIMVAWRIGIAIKNRLQPSALPLAWFTSNCRRQDNSGFTRVAISFQALRLQQGLHLRTQTHPQAYPGAQKGRSASDRLRLLLLRHLHQNFAPKGPFSHSR